MISNIDLIKGIHPGFILERELKKRNIRKGPFALSIKEFPQTIVSITKGKRRMNISLGLKIEKALDIEEGYFMILQVFHDIKLEKKNQERPDLTILRSALFWDTNIEMLDWKMQYKTVIQRVFERGNDAEKNEIIRFYGSKTVNSTILTHAD